MARKVTDNAPEPLPFGFPQTTRVILVLLGATVLVGALLAPWWTRGMNMDEETLYDAESDDGEDLALEVAFFGFPVGSEGLYLNYGAFHTPSQGSISFDSGRETATAVLGIALVGCLVFCAAAVLVRIAMAAGWIETSDDAPVRLSIVAFILGLFAVLWGAFFLPLAGDNPGWLYGEEPAEDILAESDIVEATRYANAGFFLGIVGAVGFPAYLWFDAARVRAFNQLGWTTGAPAPTA